MSGPVPHIVIDAPYRSDVVASPTPEIGWRTETDIPGWLQAGAEVEVARAGEVSSYRVDGRVSTRLAWPFAPLSAREEASLRVRVTGVDGVEGDWSEPQRVIAGFLAEGEWQAVTIGLAAPAANAQPAYLRTEFDVTGPVARATLYATALGVYQVAIDGVDVDDQVMKPGWTPYAHRTIHETTDVTRLVAEGRNAIGVRLAGAWATESFGFRENARPLYAEQPRFAGQLLIEYADGSSEWIVTDASWQASTGPITASGLYAGEDHDARLALVDRDGRGFAEAGYAADGWAPVAERDALRAPEARVSPFVRRIDDLAVREVITTPGGKTVLDFGQNLVGRLRIRVSGPAGTVITLRHAEVLEHGELGTRPLRAAAATDHYTLSGQGAEEWEPEFTFHGFRYAEIDGWPGEFDPSAVTAVVIHSDMERTGWFEASHPLVNQLHENIVWGLRGNFLYLPTDCPQRDERLGWTGDIQVFAPTASFLYDVRGFLDSWLRDLALEQVDGVVPFVVPNALGVARPAAAWGDAATIVPWVLHERYADVATVERQYPSMKGWADVLIRLAGPRRLWEGMFQFGDWLDPDAPPHLPADAKTDADIVASAYLFRSADAVARAAALLGKDDEAREYAQIAEEVRAAFLAEYVTPAGRMMSDAQTAYAMAIVFDIVPADQQEVLGARLAELTRLSGYRISTGFVGTPIIQDALTRTGNLETARRLLVQTENPSWLYPVTMGATTIWERWDSMLPDGSINPGEMTSFNHYALGAVGDWLHRVVAGLAPDAPGYERIRIQPRPLAEFDHAWAEHLTPYGTARAGWSRQDGVIRVEATVPPNTTAVVVLPDGREFEVGSGAHEWEVADTAPAAAASRIRLDSTLAAVIDDLEAYEAIGKVLEASSPEAAHGFRTHTKWSDARELGEALFMHAGPETQQEIAARLAELSAEREGATADA
ncbi:alpha-L-rhamnosidase [Microbacterium trichothecenolyticum]|uniref:alpha-L-rhamnosidase n=1 Tax=Microbacterium trichothecenolyticum TaxID=69370 RepID=UPI00285AC9EA|nr:family 78 glycoside hydrolase catalytic domain [Microbacterium trichothecenolyticum]MDR7183651.1 alpha-L-rhamnosidase [Microbacterium trichothecenolyticum]